MINRHPSLEHLLSFAEGSLSSGESLIVSAHCDMCSHCRSKVEQFTKELAHESFAESSTLPTHDSYSSMFEAIVQQPVADQIKASGTNQITTDSHIELDGRKFKLPRTLQRYASATGNWSRLVGKLWQAPVDIGGMGKAHFIFMEKGGSVPEHTHKGNELTLVINGEFSDGISSYKDGDFIAMDNAHTHAPVSHDEDGCLVFSIVDEPLHFTSGVARLLNPFSHLFF